MKLLTKSIQQKLQAQWTKGSDLKSQKVIAKIFNPYGIGRWYLINQNPENPDEVFGIVELHEVEYGMINFSELESLCLTPWKLPLERDLHFRPINAMEAYDGIRQGTFYKEGGPVVEIVNKGKRYDRKAFNNLLGDYDNDGIANVDDPHPLKTGDKKSLDDVEMKNALENIIDLRHDINTKMNAVVKKMKSKAPAGSKIYARTKTPFSIINKLIEKKIVNKTDPKRGLTDYIGTTVVFNNYEEMQNFRKLVGKENEIGIFGKVIEEEDKYKQMERGYKAYHYLIEIPDNSKMIFELQLKTKRQKALNELSHPFYKVHNLDEAEMDHLSTLADRAGRGEVAARNEIDELLKTPEKISNRLAKRKSNTFGMGGAVQKAFILPEIAEDTADNIITIIT